MVTEAYLKDVETDLPAVVEALTCVGPRNPYVVIRVSEGARLNREEWFDVLGTMCGWQPDLRQVNYDHELAREVWWEITNDSRKSDAYTYSTTAQPLHNDNAWFKDPAHINFFVMERQAKIGGEQVLLTNDQLREKLEAKNPSLLSDLLTTQVQISKGSHTEPNRTTILRNDENPAIAWNFYRTHRDVPAVAALVDKFFEFLNEMVELEEVEKVRLHDGDCIAMLDGSMLHGRTAFKVERPGERLLLQSMWFRSSSEGN